MQQYSLLFTLLVTVVLLLTELTSVPDNKTYKTTGIEYCQKISDKVPPIPISILHTKSIANTCINTPKASPILWVAVPILQY